MVETEAEKEDSETEDQDSWLPESDETKVYSVPLRGAEMISPSEPLETQKNIPPYFTHDGVM